MPPLGQKKKRKGLYPEMTQSRVPETPAEVRALLTRYGHAPNKALGQNFFVDAPALDALVARAGLTGTPVLEIGPGLGALTRALLMAGCRVAAVEKDGALVEILKDILPAAQFTHADFLKADLLSLHSDLGGGAIGAAGNLPYYATTPIALKLLLSPLPFRAMLLMVQKEAAERFTAAPGARVYGPLAVLSQLRFENVGTLCLLAPDKYYPQPQVHSAVVLLEGQGSLSPARAADFGKFLAAAFAMRRKTLFNNLAAAGFPREKLPEICAQRAETLTPAQLLSLYELLEGENA